MKLSPVNLFIWQLIAHMATIYWFFSDYFSLIGLFLVLFVYFLTGCIGMSMVYHRLLTHKSFTTKRIFEYIGTIFATVGLTGSSLSWTATHRQHHANADKKHDPHSPLVLGYIKAQWLSMFSPINIKRSPVIGSKFHRFMHRNYFYINFSYGVCLYLIGGLYALLTFYLVPACVLWNAGSFINTICHTKFLGYQRYKVGDQSVNNPLLGIVMWGEGWHNNHHRFQSRPNMGEKWYEIDIGYYIIKLIRN